MSESQDNKGFGRKMLADKSSRKMLIFVGVVIFAGLGYAMFGGGSVAKVEVSKIANAPAANSNTVLTDKRVPDSYVKAVATADQNRTVEATQSKNLSSSTPTVMALPVANPLTMSLGGGDQEGVPAIPEKPTAKPPLPVVLPTPPVQKVQQVQQVRPVQLIDPNVLNGMRTQLGQLNQPALQPAQTQFWTQPQAAGQTASNAQTGRAGAISASASPAQVASSASQPRSRFIVPVAGTILYSRLIGKVNSDTPGPIVAEILQGPYSGARLLGTFQFSEKGVIMNFSSMTVPYAEDGDQKSEVVPIHAVAVDSVDLGTAMATDIDRHILERVAVAAATSFMQGFGQAVSQSGSTISQGAYGVTTSMPKLNPTSELYAAGGAAAGSVGQIFQQVYGNRRTTVTVEADTPFGLLFVGNSAIGAN